MTLAQYLEGLRQAGTAAELERAIHAPFVHPYRGRTWAAICKVRIERGKAICQAHPNGRFIPRVEGRVLSVCGESCGVVGHAHCSTGARFYWHSAGTLAKSIMKRHGLSSRAAARIWSEWNEYPHRCLAIVEAALNGQLNDPPFDTLILSYRVSSPVNITVEANAADHVDHRATMPCVCGGTLFDWGGGFGDDLTFVHWHCNTCTRVFTEYVTQARLERIRQPRRLGRRDGARTGSLVTASI